MEWGVVACREKGATQLVLSMIKTFAWDAPSSMGAFSRGDKKKEDVDVERELAAMKFPSNRHSNP